MFCRGVVVVNVGFFASLGFRLTRPALSVALLSLPLFVFRVFADHANHAATMDNLALVANLFY
jgi:hypothetical protein